MQEGGKDLAQICSGTALNSVWVSKQPRGAEAKEGLRVASLGQ